MRRRKVTKLPTPLPIQPEEIEALQLTTQLSVTEWAAKYRKLSSMTSRFHGSWQHDKTPFLCEIMDSLSDLRIRQVTVMASAQSGKSEIGLNFLGYIIDQNPKPTLCVMPRVEDVKKRIVTRIVPLFQSTPRLLKHVGGSVAHINKEGPTVLDNMILYLATAGSAAALADAPACYILLDEVGKYPDRVGGEADPVTLAKDRTLTYGDEAKVYVCSTPKNERDLVNREFELGDKREWWFRCPHCSSYNIIKWKNVHLESIDKEFLDPSDYETGDYSWIVCPSCKSKWTDADRWKAVCAGRWVPGNCVIDKNGKIVGDIPKTTNRSYRITALMIHPDLRPFGMLASEFVTANKLKRIGQLGPLQGFINSRLAEPFKETEKVSSDKDLRRHISTYRSPTVPEGVQVLVCGVDVQQDHMWISVEGWGHMSEVWTIHQQKLDTGDVTIFKNWDKLREALHTAYYQVGNKQPLYIRKTGIDCGYKPDIVYDFCRLCTEMDVVPVMGDPYTTGSAYRTAPIVGGKQTRYNLNVTLYKDRVNRLLFESKIPGPGYWHLPQDTYDDHLKQIASQEKRFSPTQKGKVRWVMKTGVYDCHLLDCKVYSSFIAEIVGCLSLPSLIEKEADEVRRIEREKRKRLKNIGNGKLDSLPQLKFR